MAPSCEWFPSTLLLVRSHVTCGICDSCLQWQESTDPTSFICHSQFLSIPIASTIRSSRRYTIYIPTTYQKTLVGREYFSTACSFANACATVRRSCAFLNLHYKGCDSSCQISPAPKRSGSISLSSSDVSRSKSRQSRK